MNTPRGGSPFDHPDTLINPWPVYAQLRENDPVYWDAPEEWWLLTRYDDVVAALTDPRMSAEVGTPSVDNLPAENRHQFARLGTVLGTMPLFSEGQVHQRIRAELRQEFNSRTIDDLNGRLHGLAEGAVARVAQAGEIDVLADVAIPLSDAAFAETMGIATEDLPALRSINDGLIGAFGGHAHADRAQRALDSIADLTDLLHGYLETPPTAGVMAVLVKALNEDRLNELEVLGTLAQLVTGSLDPTPQVLASAVLLLTQHCDQRDELCRDPTLVPSLVEETLRLAPPFMLIHRIITDDYRCGDVTLAAGDHVALLIGAANRDPARFAEPDQFIRDRPSNRHLSFGVGRHLCVGAGLVRLVAQAAVTAFLPHLETMDLAYPPQYAPLMGIRKLASGPHLKRAQPHAGGCG